MGKFYRINQYIQAQEVRVIDEQGKQLGIMPTFNAIQKARELEVDLVEVSTGAVPPVCKLIDFKKFKYIEDKKEREEKKEIKGGELKEVQFSPFIAKNDLDYRIGRVNEFLTENNKVKLRVRFSGRQMSKQAFGNRVIDQVMVGVGNKGVMDGMPKMFGKELSVIVSPVKSGIKKDENEESKS